MTTQELKNNNSTASSGCRICLEDGSLEELIEPCECSGTLGLIHTSCLEKWLSTWNTDRCEICKYSFSVERRDKPLLESFWQWWRTRGLYGPQGVTGDTVCLVILTPLCFAATYLCGVGATNYTRLGFWEGTGLVVLCCMLVAVYFLWFFVTMRFHYKSWKKWCNRYQDVRLLVKHKIPVEQREKLVAQENSRNNASEEQALRHSSLSGLFVSLNFSFNPNAEPIYNLHQQTTFV